jgi:hypothetical protein
LTGIELLHRFRRRKGRTGRAGSRLDSGGRHGCAGASFGKEDVVSRTFGRHLAQCAHSVFTGFLQEYF